MMSEHCVLHCMLIMMCGIVLGKAKTTKVGMVWYGLVWFGMAWHGLAWLGMAWHGLAWLGMAWHGLLWFGMVWYG